MSLTTAEWEEMWEDIKTIERLIVRYTTQYTNGPEVVQRIKDKIQSVIGQME